LFAVAKVAAKNVSKLRTTHSLIFKVHWTAWAYIRSSLSILIHPIVVNRYRPTGYC